MIVLSFKIIISLVLLLGYHKPGKPETVVTNSNIRYGDTTFMAIKILRTSPGLFSIMNFEVISIDPGGKRGFPEGAYITMRAKSRIFGDNPALGKTIYVDSHPVNVAGIIRDVPYKSCLCCDIVILNSDTELPVETLVNIRCLIML